MSPPCRGRSIVHTGIPWPMWTMRRSFLLVLASTVAILQCARAEAARGAEDGFFSVDFYGRAINFTLSEKFSAHAVAKRLLAVPALTVRVGATQDLPLTKVCNAQVVRGPGLERGRAPTRRAGGDSESAAAPRWCRAVSDP